MINAIIVDDEVTAIYALREEIKHYCPHVNIIGECDGFKSAVDQINLLKPDLVFLDIHLGDGTGFNVLEHTTWKGHKVIFTTAYDNYAINAFKVNAIDYILKPISGVELLAAVNKVTNSEHPNPSINIIDNKIALQLSDRISLYNISDIIRIEASSNYSWVYCTNSEKVLSSKTLKEFEEALTPSGFVRVHHTHLINVSHLKKVFTKEGMIVEMSNGDMIPVSHRKKSLLLPMIDRIKI